MPNSEVKRNSADGSVGLPHVRVGHRQAPIYFHFFKSENKRTKTPAAMLGFFAFKQANKTRHQTVIIESVPASDCQAFFL